MSNLKVHKVVAVLPDVLEPDAIYMVRSGSGFDFYVTENTGTVAYKSNAGSASISFTEVIADFGDIVTAKNNITFPVLDSAVQAGSKVICNVSGSATTDHSTDEIMLLQLTAYATNIVEGVGFDIQVFSPHKLSGQIKINYLITN